MSIWTISLIIFYVGVILFNLILSFSYVTMLYLLMSFAIIMVPCAIILFLGRSFSHKFFTHGKGIFKIGKFKTKICEIFNVKLWKDKIPVGGKVAGFRMNKLDKPNDPKYLERYIYESCFAEWLHITVSLWGFLATIIIALIKKELFFKMALPIALIFGYQNSASVLIQWYMRPRIVKLRDMLLKRKEKSLQEETLATAK